MLRTSGVEDKGPGGCGRLEEVADALQENPDACLGIVDGHGLIRQTASQRWCTKLVTSHAPSHTSVLCTLGMPQDSDTVEPLCPDTSAMQGIGSPLNIDRTQSSAGREPGTQKIGCAGYSKHQVK